MPLAFSSLCVIINDKVNVGVIYQKEKCARLKT